MPALKESRMRMSGQRDMGSQLRSSANNLGTSRNGYFTIVESELPLRLCIMFLVCIMSDMRSVCWEFCPLLRNFLMAFQSKKTLYC